MEMQVYFLIIKLMLFLHAKKGKHTKVGGKKSGVGHNDKCCSVAV